VAIKRGPVPQPHNFFYLYINNPGWSVNVMDNSPRPAIPEMYKK
jgi:hypothetical protein